MANEELAVQLWTDHITEPSERTLDALVRHYEPLARFLARRAKMKAPPHQSLDELLSFAYAGLLDAIQKFDYTRGWKFDTYATRRIAGEIVDGQRKLDPLTRRERAAVKEYEQGYELLEVALGRPPSLEELAEELGIGVENVRLRGVMRQSMSATLDDGTSEGTPSHDELEIGLRRAELQTLVAKALPRLEPRDRALVILYYVEGRSYAEIGEALGLRENRCRQIRKDILSQLVGAA